MTDDLQRAVEAASDEHIARAIAYYRQTPTRVWGSRMVSMLTELQSRRHVLISTRDDVIEQCVAIVSEVCDQMSDCSPRYISVEIEERLLSLKSSTSL